MEEEIQSAHWRSTRCASAAANEPFKRSHSESGGGWGTAETHCQTLLNCLSAYISVYLTVCLTLPQPVVGFFQLKAKEGKPPPVRLQPHPSLIQFALICRELHLSLRAGGGGMEGEPAHCLCMNQGHWKIKADCSEIITDCSCGIILMRLGLTKPCLLYTTASLWDDYC